MARPHLKDLNAAGVAPLDLDMAATPVPAAIPPPPPFADGDAVTPMMAQYTEIKAANPDCLLFYRMGDFYELFFEDAVAASRALGITLTKRGRHRGQDIPMCGVPIHASDDYLQRLIRQGFRVAVCEQTEDPAEARKRGAKSVVRRDVIRLVTPGTLTEDVLLDARRSNFLLALAFAPDGRAEPGADNALASLDISTGEFQVAEIAGADLQGELARVLPSEVLVDDGRAGDKSLRSKVDLIGAALTPVPRASFDQIVGERMLKAQLGVAAIDGFGRFSRLELQAVAALLRYVELTQIGRRPVLRPPHRSGPRTLMAIDAATRANLELVRSAAGEKHDSLLAAIDRTVTGAGARELHSRIASPLKDVGAINDRLDAVGFLVGARLLRDRLREHLRSTPDMARALPRLAFGRGSPRDLGAIRDGLASASLIAAVLARGADGLGTPRLVAAVAARLAAIDAGLGKALSDALDDELPANRRDGGFIRAGCRGELDQNRALRDDSRKVLAELQSRYQEATGIKSLKIRHNNVLGYFVEVTASSAKAMSEGASADVFRHRQTLANVMRYASKELVDIEGRITSAAERALAIEQEIFAELAGAIAAAEQGIADVAASLAEIDLHAALAEVAAECGHVRPLLDDSTAFDIRGGRHPVVEDALKRGGGRAFIANDCVLAAPKHADAAYAPTPDGASDGSGFDEAGEARIWLVTGPNMAGKSTFLRQNALIAILAQMGAFVPARSAHIGIIDRLFSRVGAADDLARGRSTFMVEMVETAGILNQAGPRSFVILDEIGRGTATFDGLSIAWATVEHLHAVNRCRALFATHYHELTALAGKLPQVANVTIEVKEWQDEIVFLHRVVPGAADRSYGIQVAKLAGLPAAVIERAGEVLRLLEESDRRTTPAELVADLPLFAATRPKGKPVAAEPSAIDRAIEDLDPDRLSPKDALEALYRLKGLRAATVGPKSRA